jgi:dipeptidyl aminopeptidase/acylaminoacyl peptidase
MTLPETLEEGAAWPNEPSSVQAVASDSGPIDLPFQFEQGALRTVVERFLGGPPDASRLDLYRRASPSDQVHSGVCPLMLIYGVEDGQVPVATADRFVAALAEAGAKDVTYLRLAATDHCPHSLVRVPWVHAALCEFFARTLSGTGEADGSQPGPER